jgi:S1-C subfamily serine protease
MIFMGRTIRAALGAAMLLAFSSGSHAAFAQSDSPSGKSVKLTAVVTQLPVGTEYITMKVGLLCLLHSRNIVSHGEHTKENLAVFIPGFTSELKSAGFRAVYGDDNLFDQGDRDEADFQVAAVITDIHISGCTMPGTDDAKGEASMKVDWQVYAPLKKEVVAHISTSGTAKLEDRVPGGTARLFVDAFTSNAHALAADPQFRAALNSALPAANETVRPKDQEPIALMGSLKAAKRPVSDAVSSVVTVLVSDGSGSGVLLSTDGYILTNAHVVGNDKQMRVRWSDGLDSVAEVVRVSKERDVALIKTNPRDRMPLPITHGAVTPGQRVFAIGSPKGQDLQGTVSSGVISATRTVDGMRFIQSDVSVTHGSSGGALLDETGGLLGITDFGVTDKGAPLGLNFFIPIGDAMDFLSLEQH